MYPFWSVGALSTSSPFYTSGPTQGCGECFQITCQNEGGQYAVSAAWYTVALPALAGYAPPSSFKTQSLDNVNHLAANLSAAHLTHRSDTSLVDKLYALLPSPGCRGAAMLTPPSVRSPS